MVKLGNLQINIYHRTRKKSPEYARELVREVYEKNERKIKRTAKILGISKNTVRRAIRGPLNDKDKTPKRQPKKIKAEFEKLIVKEAELTGFGYKQLTGYLRKKYGLEFKDYTVKKVLYRNGRVKRKRRRKREYKMIYVYNKLRPFEQVQVDTKYIYDKTSLPYFVYRLLQQARVPSYQWTFIDVRTRIRFVFYSYNLYSYYGFLFLYFTLSYLRAHNVRTKINIRIDNGTEFTGGSRDKLKEWDEFFRDKFNAGIHTIPTGQKQYNAIVENSHRKDDEEFLIPFSQVIKNRRDFLNKAQKWLIYWNTKRVHYAKEFKEGGERVIEVLKRTGDNLINKNLIYFPVMLIEDILDHQTTTLFDLIPNNSSVYPKIEKKDTLKVTQKGVNISVPSAIFTSQR